MKYKIGSAIFEPVRGTEVKLWDWWPEGSRSKIVVDQNQLNLMGAKPIVTDNNKIELLDIMPDGYWSAINDLWSKVNELVEVVNKIAED